MRFHLAHEPVILIRAQRALPLGPLVDDRPRWPGGIVEKRLGPAARGIVHIHRLRRRLQGRQAVMIVLGVKALDVADAGRTIGDVEAVLAPRDGVFIGHRPAIRARHHAHPVRAQHVQFHRHTSTGAHGLDIGIAGQQKLAVKRLEQLRPALRRVGCPDQIKHRMYRKAPLGVLQDEGQRRRRLGDHLDAAKAHRIAGKTGARKADRVARAPRHAASPAPGHDTARGARLLFGDGWRRRVPLCRAALPEEIQYHRLALLDPVSVWSHDRLMGIRPPKV